MTTPTTPIRIVATWTIKSGHTDEFLRTAKALSESMEKNEPGCEALVWCLAEDGRTFHIFEQYTDSAAVLAHIARSEVATALPKLLQLADGPGVNVYADTTPELTELLTKFGAKFARPQFGFAR